MESLSLELKKKVKTRYIEAINTDSSWKTGVGELIKGKGVEWEEKKK